jgi:hypothetical protein
LNRNTQSRKGDEYAYSIKGSWKESIDQRKYTSQQKEKKKKH